MMKIWIKIKERLKRNERLHEYVVNSKIISRIRLEFTPLGFLRNFIFFPIRQLYRKKIHCPDYVRKMEAVHNRHKGERCFIIATGPSLTIDDLQLLKNEITIGENSIFKMYDKLGWRPTYYAMADISLTKKVVDNERADFDDFAEEYCFFNAINRNIVTCSKAIFIDINWLNHNYKKSRLFKYHPDLKYGIYDCYSITHVCLELAIYMGFQDIYMIGADNNYFGEKKHMAEIQGISSEWTDEEAALSQKCHNWGYSFINKIAKSQGVRIYNATRGGCVDVFKRVKLDEIVS